MNRSMPPGDRGCGGPSTWGPSGRAGTLSGTFGLVGGAATASREPRIGHRWATFGPRSLRQQPVGASAKAAVIRPGARESKPRSGNARRGRGRAGIVRGVGLLEDVYEIGGQQVAPLDSTRPDLVLVRAETGILFAFEPAHPAPEVARGDLPRLSDRYDNRDRFVMSFLVLGDQHGQAEFGVGLERNRKSVVSLGLLAGACHLVLPYTTIHHSEARHDQVKSAGRTKKKPVAAGAGRARRPGVCLFRPSRPPHVASGTRLPCLFHRALKKRDVDIVEIEPVSTLRRQRLDVEQLAGDFVEHLSPGGFRYARCWPLAGGLLGCGCHGTSINHSGAPGRQRNNRGVPARTARFRVTGVSRGAALKCRPPARVRRTPYQELKRNPGARPRTSG
jgi:hypothetical protein